MKTLKNILVCCFVFVLICSCSVYSTALALTEDFPVLYEDFDFKQGNEIESLRETHSKTYQMPDGSFCYVGYSDAVHYSAPDGSLHEINTDIKYDNTKIKYKYNTEENSWKTAFSDYLTAQNAVLLTKDSYQIGFRLITNEPSALACAASVDHALASKSSANTDALSQSSNVIAYTNALNNIDIIYTVKADVLKEDIILKNRNAPHKYEFEVYTNGLELSQKSNMIIFCNSQKDEIFQLAPLYMEDANGKYSESLTYSVSAIKAGYSYKITITADSQFLNAEDTVYPVVIDPSVMITGEASTYDTCIDEQYPSSNYHLRENLWTGGKTGTNTMRTYIKFNMPTNVSFSQITRAYLNLKKREYENPTIKAYRVTESWMPNTVTWNNQPAYSADYSSDTSANYTGAWYRMNVTTFVKNWLMGICPNYGFLLKEPVESNTAHKTKFYSSDAPSPNKPELVIYYVNKISSRPYQQVNNIFVNCMGYALEYDQFISAADLGISVLDMKGMNTAQMLTYINQKSEAWMSENLGDSNFSRISSYDAAINTTSPGWFRVVMRVGFYDENGNGKFDAFSENFGDHEPYDYHWWYQTSNGNGQWAEKPGQTPSKLRMDSNGVDPVSLPWPIGDFSYNSDPIYYQIKDIRNNNW